MEKKFTLMKTLTAFRNLLFSRSKKSCRAVNNDITSVAGCGITTTIHNHLKYTNDPDTSGSFLFFEQTADSQESAVGSLPSTDNDQKSKSNQPLRNVNDELAQKNLPKQVHNNWRERVNDDLAACTQVDDPLFPPKTSYKRKNDNINVDHIFTINDTKTVNNETRTNKNDAFLPFASFSFIRRSLGVSGVSTIISAVSKSFQRDDSKNLKPVFIPVSPFDKSKMRFSQNRFNQKN